MSFDESVEVAGGLKALEAGGDETSSSRRGRRERDSDV
jgi:hypothetical protein